MGWVKGWSQFIWDQSELIEFCYTVSKHFIFEYVQALVVYHIISAWWPILRRSYLDRWYLYDSWVRTTILNLNSLLRILSASIDWCRTLAQLLSAYWASYKCSILLIYWWFKKKQLLRTQILTLKWFVGVNIGLLRGTLWLAHKWWISHKLTDVTAYDFDICCFWITYVIIITSCQRYPLVLASLDTRMLGVIALTYPAMRLK